MAAHHRKRFVWVVISFALVTAVYEYMGHSTLEWKNNEKTKYSMALKKPNLSGNITSANSGQLIAEVLQNDDGAMVINSHQVCATSDVIKHFIMTKIEKTGSTTLYSLLGRYIWRNNLNIASQRDNFHIHWTKQSYGKGWLIGPRNVERADGMISHALYNQTAYDKYFAKDYKYVVSVRHPKDWIHSAVQFYYDKHLTPYQESSADRTIMNDKVLFQPRSDLSGVLTFFHLPQLQWLGYNYKKHRNDLTAIQEYVTWITTKIDVVVLNDEFDASLVVMRRKFCWSYSDIFYAAANVQAHKKKRELSEEAEKKLLSADVNLGDLLLYESLNKTWWQQAEVRQDDFWEEVTYFTETNHLVTKLCTDLSDETPVTIPASKWHEQLTLTKPFCTYLRLNTMDMLNTMLDYVKGGFTPQHF